MISAWIPFVFALLTLLALLMLMFRRVRESFRGERAVRWLAVIFSIVTFVLITIIAAEQ